MFVFKHTPYKLMSGQISLQYNLYAHLVTSDPVDTYTTISQLALAQGGNYSPQSLQNIQFLSSGSNIAILSCDNPTWSLLTTSPILPITGLVISYGSNPTDPPLSFLKFIKNGSNDPFTPSEIDLPIVLPSSGILRIKTT